MTDRKSKFDPAKERERRIAHKMTRCIHFTGTQNATCEAGVNYRALVGGPDLGWGCRLPCHTAEVGETTDRATCSQLRWTTREEADAEVDAADASYQRIRTCLKAIGEKHGKNRGLSGEMPCPTGCGGTLRYTIAASNGHVWGRCSTADCARWMQ